MGRSRHPIHYQIQPAMLLTILVMQGIQALLALPQLGPLPWLLAPCAAAIAAQLLLRKPTQLALLSWNGLIAITVALSLAYQPAPELTLLLVLAAVAVLSHSTVAFAIAVLPSLLMWLYLGYDLVLLTATSCVAVLLCYQARLWQRFARLKRLQHQRLQRQIQRRSNRDPLTGLANQRYFEQQLQLAVSQARRSKQPLSVIILDIDYFSAYNQHYGFDAGSHCLQQIALRLANASQRQSDVIAHLDGGTFALLLPATDRHGAERLASQIANRLMKAQLPHAGSPISRYLTLSQGLSQWQPGMEAQQLLLRAQHTMGLAKQQGRDQIQVA